MNGLDPYETDPREFWREIQRLRAENTRLRSALIPFLWISRAEMERLGFVREQERARRAVDGT